MRKLLAAACLALLVGALVPPAPAVADEVPKDATWHQVYFPSDDGTMLHADVFLPKDRRVNDQHPVILSIGPYFGSGGLNGGPAEAGRQDQEDEQEAAHDRRERYTAAPAPQATSSMSQPARSLRGHHAAEQINSFARLRSVHHRLETTEATIRFNAREAEPIERVTGDDGRVCWDGFDEMLFGHLSLHPDIDTALDQPDERYVSRQASYRLFVVKRPR